MKLNRRNFFKAAGIASAGIVTPGVVSCKSEAGKPAGNLPEILAAAGESKIQEFNMCGFAAPKLDVVRIGIVGLGNRGPGAVERMASIDGVEIKALCDIRMEKVVHAQNIVTSFGLPEPDAYGEHEESWKEMCSRDDIDLVYIATPWSLHTPMAVFAMEQGKHAATEVPAATSIEETWQLVETSERTQKHCMMLENCCYDFFELMTLNMAQQGLFGELVHAEAAYIHDLREKLFEKDSYYDMWRLRENQNRNGNLYPTHGLGPVAQALNINRGDKMNHLVSMSTHDYQMAPLAADLSAEDSFYDEFNTDGYRGNMSTTLIKTEKGKTILVQHDVTSPRPYSRIHLLSGTKGVARKWPDPGRVAMGHQWLTQDEMKELEKEYTPAIVTKMGEIAKRVGGHGGMDFIMDWRLIDNLRNGRPLDQDVYDAALWSSIGPLSEWSVANQSNSIEIPDFTAGSYKQNLPVNLGLEGGGNTGFRTKKEAAGVQLVV